MTNTQIEQNFAAIRRGLDSVPNHQYRQERELRKAIGVAVDNVMTTARQLGLSPSNWDGAHYVEAVMWEWATKNNSFGFGLSLKGIGER